MNEKAPEDFNRSFDVCMSNSTDDIENWAVPRLKTEEIVFDYTGWDFCGHVWWCRNDEKFKCEVDQYGSHIQTVVGDTLQEIMSQCCELYGSK